MDSVRTPVVLIRHAQVTVVSDLPADQWQLSPDGAAAARNLREHPALAHIDLICASPEPKAVATAVAIAGDKPIQLVPNLREIDRASVGWIESAGDYASAVKSAMRQRDERILGPESAGDARRRIVNAVDDLIAQYTSKRLAIVSHGIVLSLLVYHFVGLPNNAESVWPTIRIPDVAVVDWARGEMLVKFGQGSADSSLPNKQDEYR